MKTSYECLGCAHTFDIEINEQESRSSLDPARSDACPHCRQRVGWGQVRCFACDAAFELWHGHWHVRCTLAGGPCPGCARRHQSTCVC